MVSTRMSPNNPSKINPAIINAPVAGFLDAVASEYQRFLAPATISWNRDQPDSEVSDLVWWSCALSIDPACRIYAGANREVWKEIGGGNALDSGAAEAVADDPQASWFALLTQSIERAAKSRFGALVSCTELGILEGSPNAWARVSVAIGRDASSSPGAMCWVLSPELVAALGGEDEDNGVAAVPGLNTPAAANSLDLLQHVEIPVSVSFGRTHMRLRDLLSLANGSVVQLDRELGDEVEVRVNNCVIARGEVVAVDGNYGVRILEMASQRLDKDRFYKSGIPAINKEVR
jgi:flagellar motor switch protein FliN/FliY